MSKHVLSFVEGPALIAAGNKLEAIRAMREARGLGLTEAKDLVEQSRGVRVRRRDRSGAGLGIAS